MFGLVVQICTLVLFQYKNIKYSEKYELLNTLEPVLCF